MSNQTTTTCDHCETPLRQIHKAVVSETLWCEDCGTLYTKNGAGEHTRHTPLTPRQKAHRDGVAAGEEYHKADDRVICESCNDRPAERSEGLCRECSGRDETPTVNIKHLGGKTHNGWALSVSEHVGRNARGQLDAWLSYILRRAASNDETPDTLEGEYYAAASDIALALIEKGMSYDEAMVEAVWEIIK